MNIPDDCVPCYSEKTKIESGRRMTEHGAYPT